MPSGLLNLALGLAMQVGSPGPQVGYPGPQVGYPGPQAGSPGLQYGYSSPQVGYPGPQAGYPAPPVGLPGPQVGSPGPSEMPNSANIPNAFGQYGSEGSSEQRYPFDSQQNWVHGYFQEIPAYGGHPVFRPYNYKDVLSQSQTAAGWGERPMMPYSQQFWHKYHDQATMLKSTQAAPMGPRTPWNGRPQQGFVGSSIAVPGHQIIAPASGTHSFTAPQQTFPSYGPASVSESQGPALQPSAGPFTPALYQR